MLRDLWATATYSSARADILNARGAAPQRAGHYVDEVFDDCEPRVRQLACGAADPATLTLVRARRDDPFEDDEVRSAAADRLTDNSV